MSAPHLSGEVGLAVAALQHEGQLLVKGGCIDLGSAQQLHELVNRCTIPLHQTQRGREGDLWKDHKG